VFTASTAVDSVKIVFCICKILTIFIEYALIIFAN